MANHDVTSYKIGNDIYYYRDNQSLIALDNKVDKEEGKELSSNDYTDEDKEKLAELENITVDNFLSTGSENPVQNKVLTEEINGIKDSRATSQNFGLAKAGLGLISEQGVLSIDSNYSPYTLPEATSETLGGIKVGEGLSIDDGTLSADSVDIATDQTPGIVQIGEGLDIDESGVLSVKIDNIISSESENPVQNKIIAQALIDNRYTLPIASENTLGGIKVGNNLTIDANGTLNAEAGGASALEDLSDVDIASLTDGEVLVYNGTSEKWENKEVPSGTDDYSDLDNKPSINSVTLNGNKTSSDLGIVITLTQAQYNALSTEEKNDTNKVYYITDSSGGGGTVEVSMADITDVEFSSLSDGQILKYDAANSQWVNEDEVGGSSALADLEDVNVSNPTDRQVLKYDATNEEWINDDDAGGTEVEANPAGEATADLEKIQIGETIYDLPKIGSSYKEIVLYHSDTDENTYILSQPITNFDAIVITAQFTGAVSNAFAVRTFLVSELEEYIGETNQFEISSNDDYIWFGITDASTFTKKAQDDFKIIKIVGVQYGSGLGENSEIINISSGDGTTSRTFTLSKTPKFVAISWDEIDGWSRYHNFVWGDKRAYGFAGNTDSALSNQYATVVKITYGSDNKSFTITGGNASATFNTTTGSGRLYLEYGEGGSENGGTSVEANPQEEPTDSLETIKIGDIVYDIPGGGGSYTKDLIYENTSGVSGSSQQIIVTKAVTDYDVISVVYSTYNDGGYSTRGESYYSPPYQKDSTNFRALWYPTYGNRWIVLEGTPGATTVTLSTGVYGEGSGYTPIIYEIYGIKFGSGSGGGSSYIEDILYNPTTPSSSSSWSSPINTEISKTDVEKYDMLVFGIGCDDHTRTFGYLLPSRLNDSKSSVLLTVNEEATAVKNCYIIYNTNDELCVYTNTGTTTYVFDVTGIKFGSGGGGSGTEVEANPQDEPTDTLETIKIGNTVYDIAGGGNGRPSGEIIQISSGDNTSSRTFTFDRPPKRITATWNTGSTTSDWAGNWNFVWGDSYVVYLANTRVPAISGDSGGIASIAYGADGKSFTITGGNAFGALNSSGGYGLMYVEYGTGSGGSIGSVSEIVTELNTAIADGTTVTLNLTKKYNDPYVMATNVLPKSSWGGIVTVDESYGITYDRGNNTISFKVYTNKGQNYDINWLVFDLSNDTFAQNNYYTTEQVAGTWVDGKTIYKTTIDPISSASNGQQQVSLSTYGISNVDTICKIEGVVLTSGGSVALNYFNGSGDCFNLFMTSNNTIIVLAHYGSWTNSIQTYITLYYTKTSS